MKLLEKLNKYNKPCENGLAWLLSLNTEDLTEIYKIGVEHKYYEWLSWGLIRLLSTANVVKYAKFAAEVAYHTACYAAEVFVVHYADDTTRTMDNYTEDAVCYVKGAAKGVIHHAIAAEAIVHYAIAADIITYSKTYKKILNYGFNLLMGEMNEYKINGN
jgi:hypothetical protein